MRSWIVAAGVSLLGPGCGGAALVEAIAALPGCDTLLTDPVCVELYGSSSSSGDATASSSTGAGVAPTSMQDAAETGETGAAEGSGGSSGDSSGPAGTSGANSSGTGDEPGLGEALTAQLSVVPAQALAPGPVEVHLQFHGPAVAVDLYDGDTPLLLGAAPKGALFEFVATSDDVPGDGLHTLKAVVRAGDGRTVQTHAELWVDLPPGGSEDWAKPVPGEVSGYSSVAMAGYDPVVAGYFEKGPTTTLVVARLDRATGEPLSGPILLDKITWSGESRGPALAVGPDGAVYVAATWVTYNSVTRRVHKLDMGGKDPIDLWKAPSTGDYSEEATGVAVLGERVYVVGSKLTNLNPPQRDLKLWRLEAETGAYIDETTFYAPPSEDKKNERSERAYAVAVVGDKLVVVGTREFKPEGKFGVYVRSVVLLFTVEGKLVDEWTSPGDILDEDAALAVAPTQDGGFVTTGWAGMQFLGAPRQVLTRRFAIEGEEISLTGVRPEPTPGTQAVGHAIAEDLEGKLIIAASCERPETGLDAWVFAAPGMNGARTWEVFRNGASDGPDEAVGLALDAWGYVHAVGSELDQLVVHAFALRLFP